MLRRAGVADLDRGAAAYGAAAGLQLATTLTIRLLTLPAVVIYIPMERNLRTPALLAVALLAAVVAVGVVGFATNRPLELAGRAVERLINATVRRKRPITGIAGRLVSDRDALRSALGTNWKTVVVAAAGNTVLDYLALLAALYAVRASPEPALVLLAYTTAGLLALVPFTPGGIGFVEGGLVATVTVAGVPVADALTAILLYRLVSYWLPLAGGGVAYLLFRHRYGHHRIRRGPS
jgi:uncharacterized protein (TIRG00374 family)